MSYLAQLIKQQTPDGPSRVMAQVLVQGALVAAQNKNAMVSATGELVGMLSTKLYQKETSELTEGEKEIVSALATLFAAQTGKTVVENNSLAGDKARESLKGSNEWWKWRVRDTLGENTSLQITKGMLNSLEKLVMQDYWRQTRRLTLQPHWSLVA